jgi:hypothetical protein
MSFSCSSWIFVFSWLPFVTLQSAISSFYGLQTKFSAWSMLPVPV